MFSSVKRFYNAQNSYSALVSGTSFFYEFNSKSYSFSSVTISEEEGKKRIIINHPFKAGDTVGIYAMLLLIQNDEYNEDTKLDMFSKQISNLKQIQLNKGSVAELTGVIHKYSLFNTYRQIIDNFLDIMDITKHYIFKYSDLNLSGSLSLDRNYIEAYVAILINNNQYSVVENGYQLNNDDYFILSPIRAGALVVLDDINNCFYSKVFTNVIYSTNYCIFHRKIIRESNIGFAIPCSRDYSVISEYIDYALAIDTDEIINYSEDIDKRGLTKILTPSLIYNEDSPINSINKTYLFSSGYQTDTKTYYRMSKQLPTFSLPISATYMTPEITILTIDRWIDFDKVVPVPIQFTEYLYIDNQNSWVITETQKTNYWEYKYVKAMSIQNTNPLKMVWAVQ